MGAGTLNAEPRSTSDSVRIDTLSTAVRQNVKDCSEAVAFANLPNAILTGCDLTNANLTNANLTGANLAFATGWDTVKGKGTIFGLDTATGVP